MVEQFALYVGSNHQRQNHLHRNLELLGIELHGAHTIYVAKEMMQKCYYRLFVMSYSTLGKEIFKFCSFIRSYSAHNIIIVLMSKIKIHVEEQLFDHGVRDVVAGKQASARALTKRIQAHLREANSHWSRNNTILIKGTVIDLDRREVRHDGNCYQLRGILTDLMKYFLDNPDRIISREELQESPIWADSICTPAKEGGKTFDVNVGKLRKVIELNPAKPQIIESVRGIGWKLAMEFDR